MIVVHCTQAMPSLTVDYLIQVPLDLPIEWPYSVKAFCVDFTVVKLEPELEIVSFFPQ